MDIVDETYHLTKQFPTDEIFGLSSQMKRCSVSIVSNIAEGWGRGSDKSFVNFLRIARSSLYELETQLEVASRQRLIDREAVNKLNSLLIEESKMLHSFIKSIIDKNKTMN